MRACADRPALQRRGGAHVIDVRMGVDDGGDLGAAFFEPGTNLLEIAPRIDDDGGLALVIDEDRAVAAQQAPRGRSR